MHLNITDSEKGDNKGSSGQLIHYLDKETRIHPEQDPELWFNGSGSGFEAYEIRNRLDKNIAKLCRNDSKFFLVNISPSKKEIAHLKSLYGELGAKEQLKTYATKIMDEYARNFKRNGINQNTDLLWFGKLENHRYYSFKDLEVKNGTARRGQAKPGEQMHIQVIVSRKDITNKIKLSPNNKSRGRNAAHSKIVGEFNRVAFKNSGERVFDDMFNFTRPLTETFEYANAMVNGSLEERIAVHADKNRIEPGWHQDTNQDKRVGTVQSESTLLDILLAKADFDPPPAPKRKKKRRKAAQQESELSF